MTILHTKKCFSVILVLESQTLTLVGYWKEFQVSNWPTGHCAFVRATFNVIEMDESYSGSKFYLKIVFNPDLPLNCDEFIQELFDGFSFIGRFRGDGGSGYVLIKFSDEMSMKFMHQPIPLEFVFFDPEK